MILKDNKWKSMIMRSEKRGGYKSHDSSVVLGRIRGDHAWCNKRYEVRDNDTEERSEGRRMKEGGRGVSGAIKYKLKGLVADTMCRPIWRGNDRGLNKSGGMGGQKSYKPKEKSYLMQRPETGCGWKGGYRKYKSADCSSSELVKILSSKIDLIQNEPISNNDRDVKDNLRKRSISWSVSKACGGRLSGSTTIRIGSAIQSSSRVGSANKSDLLKKTLKSNHNSFLRDSKLGENSLKKRQNENLSEVKLKANTQTGEAVESNVQDEVDCEETLEDKKLMKVKLQIGTSRV